MRRFLFSGRSLPLPGEGGTPNEGGNRQLLDTNGDDGVDVADVVYLLAHLFGDGAPPATGTRSVRMVGCPSVCRF